jgi:N6-L-threonylcarbamoyladenine synthase
MATASRIIKKKPMLILGIESSADDTCAAVVEAGQNILSNIRSSQIEIHNLYGGIVPEVASRKHIEAIALVVQKALDEAKVTLEDIDKVAVTVNPGLKPALLVGQTYAQGLALGQNKPLIEVNHLFGHVYANFLQYKDKKPETDDGMPSFPLITLLVSGGHTQIVLSTSPTTQKIIGETHDDAAGEAFDKVARMLELGYPGGPIIDKLATEGFEDAINFPRPMISEPNHDFSFSGLKTAVKKYVEENSKFDSDNKELNESLKDHFIKDVVASFQEAVVEVLVKKTIDAASEIDIDSIALAGGVAANSRLRDIMARACLDKGFKLYYPPIELCMDNAAMIAGAAYHLE